MLRARRAAALAGLLLAGSLAARPGAEVLTRRATTLAAVRVYPTFFNGQPVILRAEIDRTEKRVLLVDGDDKLPALVPSGVVKWNRGLVIIAAEDLNETSPLAEAKPEQVTVAPTFIPPEVLFSAPTADETEVPLNVKVRIQFSRDLDTATIKGHVEVAYSMAEARQRGEPEPPPIVVRVGYNPVARVMEIRFDPPLERFRIVEVKLTEGIVGTDGAPLKPWSVKFTTGGS
jgi:hypothetical protein